MVSVPFSTRSKLLAALIVVALLAWTGMGMAFAQSAPQGEALEPSPIEVGPIWLNTVQGRFEFQVEIADEPSERQRGLMFRELMPVKNGMLFDFGKTSQIQMWMRNTPLSLDMIFILPDGTVGHIAERTTPFSDAIIDSRAPVSHVLEINAGVSKLIGLKVGDTVELPQ